MGKRISPATAISLVALFFSLGGAGLAATGYRITSIWQIAPRVRRELRGAARVGPPGPQGVPGPDGAGGVAGPQGVPGPSGTVDWSGAYTVIGAAAELTTGSPSGWSQATCRGNDRVLTGGFESQDATISASAMGNDDFWAVQGQLTGGVVSGYVTAWAECIPAG